MFGLGKRQSYSLNTSAWRNMGEWS